MKTYFIIFFILLFSITSNAQNTFNKVFYPSSTQKLITSVTVFDGKTIFVGIDVDSFQFVGNMVLFELDINGDIINQKILKNDSIDLMCWNKSLLGIDDTLYLVCYENLGSTYNRNALYTLNFTDTIKTVSLNLPSPDFSLRPDGMTRLNNEFFVIGLYQNLTVPSMFADVYFSKVSKSYELIWTKKIGSNWDDIVNNGAIKSSTNNTILLGYTQDNRNLTTQNYIFKSIIEERDTAGNLLRQYVSPNGRLQTMLSDIVPNADGSLVYACQQAWEVYHPSVSSFEMNGLVVKLDSNFNEVWNLPVRGDRAIEGMALPLRNIVKATSNGGGYVASGSFAEIDYINNTGKGNGLILRIGENGDSLWARKIIYPGQTNNFDNMFYDLKETPDKGFIMCGSLRQLDTITYPLPNNFTYGWVVKTDSMGCVVPGCHLYDGLAENKMPSHVMKVFPNPADDMISIYYKAATMPVNAELHVYNQEGKLLQKLAITSNDATYMFPLINYTSGIYFVSLIEQGEKVQTEKIIVNRSW
jgi:hypothetical protein